MEKYWVLSLVGYSYLYKLLWEWLLLINGKYFVMGWRYITMTTLLLSDNFCNDLLWVVSKIFFIWHWDSKKFLSLIWSMIKRHFLLSVILIFQFLFYLHIGQNYLRPQYQQLFTISLYFGGLYYLLSAYYWKRRRLGWRE